MDVGRAIEQRQARLARRRGQQADENAALTPANALLHLQGVAGNAAVARLIQREEAADAAAPPEAEAAPAAPTAIAELDATTRSAIATDAQAIVTLLSGPAMDDAVQEELVGIVHRWLQTDAASGNATPHLDELLRILKDRPLKRRTVRSMEKTTAQNAYDALWIALGEEHLGAFAAAAARSAEGSTGPLAGESAGFWAGLSRTRAMSLYDAFERLAPGADSHDRDTIERLSRALVGIEADPEWMQLVEQGGEFKGSRVFGSEFPSTEHVLLDSETRKIRNQQARYLWRMVDSAEEELPWLGERVEASVATDAVRRSAKEIGKRIDLLQKTARLSNNAVQRDTRTLAEIVQLTGWVTRLAAKGYGTDDTETRELLRRTAKNVARELERGKARVSTGSYESMLIAELERPETDLPDRQEKIAAILLDLVADAADQLVESGHPGGGASDEPTGTPAQAE
jgi:hypothetical protein